jgi:quinoprotein glucose dehydrogenase
MAPWLAVTAFGAGKNWACYLGDAGATHYSHLRQINRRNIATLTPAWTFHTGDVAPNNLSQIQCNPLIIDGVLYGTTPQLKLFALDAATGRERWRLDPAAPRAVNRGLAWWSLGPERRLLFAAGRYLHAVDPESGKLIESFGDHGRVDLSAGLDREVQGLYLGATTPGAIYQDLIIVSIRVGEGPAPAAPGHICAYDVRTGMRRWVFHTIPWPGEYGYETWPGDAWKRIGGANCWAGLVIDQERGIAFLPIGSATFDFWGGDRLGENLFADCLIALDAATGKRKWHFQFTHHDLWDRDPPAAPVLCTVIRNGRSIPAVAQTTKTGHVWVFDRETGESLFPWREEEVPPSLLQGETASRTQRLPLLPAPFARQRFTEEEVTRRTPEAHEAVLRRLRSLRPHVPFDPPSEQGTVIFPGFDGGGEWGGAAVDPEGVLYVNSNEMAWVLQMIPIRDVGGDAGQQLFRQVCAACHGANREGNAAQNVPSLINVAAKLSTAEVVALLRGGRGMMPAFAFLSDAQKNALADFVRKGPSDPTSPREIVSAGAATNRADTKIEAPDDNTGATAPYTTTGYNRFLDPEGYPAVRPPWGTLSAIDLNTGNYRWQRPLGEIAALTARGIPITGTENYGGPVVTAGGVVIIAATKDEKIRGFDCSTGDQLWEAPLPAGGYATPATYEVDGRQYVVIACGGGKMGTKSGDAYVSFALPAESVAASESMPATASDPK